MSKYNFKGWKLKGWFIGNGKTIKEILKVGLPLFLTFLATKNPAFLVLGTAVGKLLLDTVEYYCKE